MKIRYYKSGNFKVKIQKSADITNSETKAINRKKGLLKLWTVFCGIVLFFNTIALLVFFSRLFSHFSLYDWAFKNESNKKIYLFLMLVIFIISYFFSKFLIKKIDELKISSTKKKIFKFSLPFTYFFISFISVAFSLILVDYYKMRNELSQHPLNEKKIWVFKAVQSAEGYKDSDLNQTFLNNFTVWSIETITKKAKETLKLSGYDYNTLPIVSHSAHYIFVDGKKLAIIRLNFGDKVKALIVAGIKGDEFIRVACIGMTEILIFSGECGEEIKKTFEIKSL